MPTAQVENTMFETSTEPRIRLTLCMLAFCLEPVIGVA